MLELLKLFDEISHARARIAALDRNLTKEEALELGKLNCQITPLMNLIDARLNWLIRANTEGDFRLHSSFKGTFENCRFFLQITQTFYGIAITDREDITNLEYYLSYEFVIEDERVYPEGLYVNYDQSYGHDDRLDMGFIESFLKDNIKDWYRWKAGMSIYKYINGLWGCK